jgi:hypothetical protein
VSREALITAGESMGAFDPTPMPDSLAMCLRPYEQLVPGCNLESDIRQAVARYERVGLVGGIGSGKSGVSRYALGGPGLGMIALNVVTEDREKIATVRGFLEILVAQLLSRATAASRLSGEARERLLASSAPTEPLPRTEIRSSAELGGGPDHDQGDPAAHRTRPARTDHRPTRRVRRPTRQVRRAAHRGWVASAHGHSYERASGWAARDARRLPSSPRSRDQRCIGEHRRTTRHGRGHPRRRLNTAALCSYRHCDDCEARVDKAHCAAPGLHGGARMKAQESN